MLSLSISFYSVYYSPKTRNRLTKFTFFNQVIFVQLYLDRSDIIKRIIFVNFIFKCLLRMTICSLSRLKNECMLRSRFLFLCALYMYRKICIPVYRFYIYLIDLRSIIVYYILRKLYFLCFLSLFLLL